ncbi:MAG TPA: hypothetical protein VNS63_00580, partial [Blastocatellia bacterium]|nr:hypothetical protein [Blastocatellia bacterium]
KRKNIPKRLARVVMSGLAKDTGERPATAAGFASALRAQSEGTGALLRRAFALYSEHFPKFFRVSLLVMLPIITLSFLDIVNVILKRKGILPEGASKGISLSIQILNGFGTFIASSIIVGVTIRLVNQLFLAPLRPIELRLAFAALKKRIRSLMVTQLMVAIGSLIGLCLFIVPGVIFYINSSLSGPVVMMENLKGRAALRRSKALVSRARRTVVGIIAMQYLIPLFFSSIAATLIVSSVALSGDAGLKAFAPKLTSIMSQTLNVLIVPLISTFTALLYLKTRAAGGESLNEAFIQLQEEEQPSRKWEIRIRERMHSSTSGSR